MDPPPLPPHPTTIVNPNATIRRLDHSNSFKSSPRAHQTDNWDEPLPPVPGAKLRLMCSFGGHIIPRPHDKTLCYVGGETRIIVMDRNSTLSDLHSRLSRTILNGRQFSLKYQLPSEDLDSLISVTSDEDLENMIEEHDRVNSTSPLNPSRLRLYLFLAKPETATSMGALLDDAKSETWFVDALNNADFLHRRASDSAAAIDNLLEFDSCFDLEAQNESMAAGNKNVDQEIHSTMPDSPMVETTSSFDSSISSPSMTNLNPVNVRIEDCNEHNIGLEEKFLQLKVGSSAQPSFPTDASGVATVASSGDSLGRVISDDERSDKGMPLRLRKPPLPLQSVQRKINDCYSLASPDSKHSYNLQSPDSVASDSSIASAASLSKHSIYQESLVSTTTTDLKTNITNQASQIQIQQQNHQQQQQQFIHANTQYIQHPSTGSLVPISSFYPVYANPTQQPFHQQIDQQYMMYYLPVTHTQTHNNVALQSNTVDGSTSRPSSPLETSANVYGTGTAPAAPALVQVLPNQFQQQFIGFSHLPRPNQSQQQFVTAASTATGNHGFNYSHPTPVPSQYQTTTTASGLLALQAADNIPNKSELHNHDK